MKKQKKSLLLKRIERIEKVIDAFYRLDTEFVLKKTQKETIQKVKIPLS